MIVLGCMNLDIILREDRLINSHEDKKYMDKWDQLNRMSLMIMKCVILKAFRDTLFEEAIAARIFLEELKKKFTKNDKVETSTILTKLLSMKYKGKENIRKYILEMFHLASKLKALKLELSKNLFVYLVLISLPT
ncbi:unnamed protein product [Spirodela intermedia]|uniref:Uncharacterized protein n=1 Tax=Spirodela intermedia TaxID=51605 RepID=A0A7I8JZE4_SPIIN|nr:unnamed protein product [Spirodela intermedia]